MGDLIVPRLPLAAARPGKTGGVLPLRTRSERRARLRGERLPARRFVCGEEGAKFEAVAGHRPGRVRHGAATARGRRASRALRRNGGLLSLLDPAVRAIHHLSPLRMGAVGIILVKPSLLRYYVPCLALPALKASVCVHAQFESTAEINLPGRDRLFRPLGRRLRRGHAVPSSLTSTSVNSRVCVCAPIEVGYSTVRVLCSAAARRRAVRIWGAVRDMHTQGPRQRKSAQQGPAGMNFPQSKRIEPAGTHTTHRVVLFLAPLRPPPCLVFFPSWTFWLDRASLLVLCHR